MTQTKVEVKHFEAGDFVIRQGDKSDCFYVLQSGLVAVGQVKEDGFLQLMMVGAPFVLAFESVFSNIQNQFDILCTRPSTLISIPKKIFLSHFNQSPDDMTYLVFRGLFERSKQVLLDLKSKQLTSYNFPCSPESTAKLFGLIYHCVRIHSTEGASNRNVNITASFLAVGQMITDIFEIESYQFEQALLILSRLGYCKLENNQICLINAARIEEFAEFYARVYFRGGNQGALSTNQKLTQMVECLLDFALDYKTDQLGNVHLPYLKVIEQLKNKIKGFEADQLFRLEQKGLMLKRTSGSDGGLLSFYKGDFEQLLTVWNFLREIEAWNRQGWIQGSFEKLGYARQTIEQQRAILLEKNQNWLPRSQLDTDFKLRYGFPKLNQIWCPVCMSELDQLPCQCKVCGAEVAQPFGFKNKAA